MTALPGSIPLSQAAKRRAEAAAAQKNKNSDVASRRSMVKKEDVMEETSMKKRRKGSKGGDQNGDDDTDSKHVLLPQKKRAFVSTSSPSQSPMKKSAKTNGEDNVDNETLIRETEADLKSLSGSWPGPRHAFYNRSITETEDRFESPGFENLFDEKKSKEAAASTVSTGSEISTCSLKDVITLRDQQDGKAPKHESRSTNAAQARHENNSSKSNSNAKSNSKSQQKEEKDPQPKTAQERNYLESLIKIETVCDSIQSQVKSKTGDRFNRYEPDFNELVDDSSNDLEIDTSEPEESGVKHEKSKKKDAEDTKHNKSKSGSFTSQKSDKNKSGSPTAFVAPAPVRDGKSKITSNNIDLQTPIGPFPAAATFVGYPPSGGPPGVRVAPEEKPSTVHLLPLKPSVTKPEPADEPPNVTSSKLSASSPENPASKHYTILQPAGAGSRAASAIQDAAGVPAVSSSTVSNPGSDSSSKSKEAIRALANLSPSSMAAKGNLAREISAILAKLKIFIQLVYVWQI